MKSKWMLKGAVASALMATLFVTNEMPATYAEEVKQVEIAVEPSKVKLNKVSHDITWEIKDAIRYQIKVVNNVTGKEYPVTVKDNVYDLDRLKLANNEEFTMQIVPKFKSLEPYDKSKAMTVIFTTYNGEYVLKSEEAVETMPTVSFDEKTHELSWLIDEAIRFQVRAEKLVANEYVYVGTKTLKESVYDLDRMQLANDAQYRITITPKFPLQLSTTNKKYVAHPYEEEKAIMLTLTTVDGKYIVEGLSQSTKEEATLPAGLTYDAAKQILVWEPIDGARNYFVEMQRKNEAGIFEAFEDIANKTIRNYSLEHLESGQEYRLTIVPQINNRKDLYSAYELAIDTKNGVKITDLK